MTIPLPQVLFDNENIGVLPMSYFFQLYWDVVCQGTLSMGFSRQEY